MTMEDVGSRSELRTMATRPAATAPAIDDPITSTALSPKKDDQPAMLPQRLEKLIERSLPDPTAKLQKRLKAIEKAKSV